MIPGGCRILSELEQLEAIEKPLMLFDEHYNCPDKLK